MALIGLPNTKKIIIFVVLYILGNILALTATGFLLGKRRNLLAVKANIFPRIYRTTKIIIFLVFGRPINANIP